MPGLCILTALPHLFLLLLGRPKGTLGRVRYTLSIACLSPCRSGPSRFQAIPSSWGTWHPSPCICVLNCVRTPLLFPQTARCIISELGTSWTQHGLATTSNERSRTSWTPLPYEHGFNKPQLGTSCWSWPLSIPLPHGMDRAF